MGSTYDIRFFNIVIVAVSFILIFSAFSTASYCMKNVLDAEKRLTNGQFTGDGYISLGLLYVVFALTNWLSPIPVKLLGPKWSMVVASLTYCAFVAQFMFPSVFLLYSCSVLIGLGAAVLWVAQGTLFAENSDKTTVGRNSGIFWALFHTSSIWGNIFQYFVLRHDLEITGDVRFTLFSGLTGTGLAGTLMLMLIRPLPKEYRKKSKIKNNEDREVKKETYERTVGVVKGAIKLFMEKDSLLLCLTYLHSGFESALRTGIFSAIVGHTLNLGQEARGMMGIAAIAIAVGEILGCGLLGLLSSSKVNEIGRDAFVMAGYVILMVDFYLIFLSFPNDSPKQDSRKLSVLPQTLEMVILTGFLMGLGDSTILTQTYSTITIRFKDQPSEGFAISALVRSLAMSIMFFIGSAFTLTAHILLLSVLASLGTITYCMVEWKLFRVSRVENRIALVNKDEESIVLKNSEKERRAKCLSALHVVPVHEG